MRGAGYPEGDHRLPVSVEIIVPAHNEAHRLPGGLNALTMAAAALPCSAEILVVDNASTDTTAAIVEEWPPQPVPVRLLRCARRGKGAAVRTGLLASRAPFVGYLDADMATDLSALSTAISLLVTGHQVVIGSRAHAASTVENRHSLVRTLGAAVFRGAARVIVAGVTDTQCGFKFFSGPLVRAAAAPLTTAGFSFDVELLARCRLLGGDVTEIPVNWRDMPGSTFSVQRHSISAFAELAAIWVSLRAGDRGPRIPIPVEEALDAGALDAGGLDAGGLDAAALDAAAPVLDDVTAPDLGEVPHRTAGADPAPGHIAEGEPPAPGGTVRLFVSRPPGEARAPST